LEHGHASSVSNYAKFVANDRQMKLHILAKGIKSHFKKQCLAIARVKILIKIESTSTKACVDRTRVFGTIDPKSSMLVWRS
jgi:hypothetical protein